MLQKEKSWRHQILQGLSSEVCLFLSTQRFRSPGAVFKPRPWPPVNHCEQQVSCRDVPSVPTSVPMASTTKSALFPTMPVSRPGPQALTFWGPASSLTWTSNGLKEDKVCYPHSWIWSVISDVTGEHWAQVTSHLRGMLCPPQVTMTMYFPVIMG